MTESLVRPPAPPPVPGTAPPAPAPPSVVPSGPPSARRRLRELADVDSFAETGSQARGRSAGPAQAGDGVVTGVGRLDGRTVALFAQDNRVLGGSVGEIHAEKVLRVMQLAERVQAPVVGLIDSGGARIQEGVAALDGYGAIFRQNVRLSGRVPQVSVVLGGCAGGAVYSPALTDIVIMARDRAHMFLTGPRVVKAVTFEDVTPADLGGAELHSRASGVAHLVADDADSATALARRVLSYLPSSCHDLPPLAVAAPAAPMPVVPANHRHAYDVRTVIRGVVDRGSMLELQARYARNLVTAFGRIEGRPVGVVANQPQALAGTINSAAAEKGARFVRLCDAFGLPLVTLVDTPGFLPGRAQEAGGVIRRGAKLLYAFSEATVPRVTVILRKAYGGAYIVMNSRSLGADAVFSWPDAEIAVMGAAGAVEILHRRALQADPASKDQLIDEYHAEISAQRAAQRLSVDEVIEPADTRRTIAATLRSLTGALQPGYRHDNLPQ